MAYGDDWDVTTPSDSDLASSGDDEIRSLKRGLDERLASFFTNWPDGEPLEGPASTGATVSSGLLADKPNPATTDFYLATDEGTGTLYVKEGVAYVRATPTPAAAGALTIKRGAYNDAAGAGTRATAFGDVAKILSVLVTGHTDAGSLIVVDLDEFNDADTMNIANYYHVSKVCGISAELWQGALGTAVLADGFSNVWSTDTALNQIAFQLVAKDGTNAAAAQTIQIMLTLFFSE